MAKNSPYALLYNVKMYTQPEALKEAKDFSKNLVSGEFEREYRSDMGVKPVKKRHACLATVCVSVGVLFVWLLVLTILREVQIASLKKEVDHLTANMIAMSATVKNLHDKISHNRLFDEFKTLDDTIYADMDQDGIPVDDITSQERTPYGPLDKLHDLTVLEDDDDLDDDDDEDLYEDDDVESGDWYHDYDKREKNGQTNMVKLKPEDFGGIPSIDAINHHSDKVLTDDEDDIYGDYDNKRQKIGKGNMITLKPDDYTGSVVTVGKDEKTNSVIRDIKRILNKNPEASESELSALAKKAKELSQRNKRSVFQGSPIVESVDHFAAPRAFSKHDERRKPKKYGGDAAVPKVAHSSRTVRNSDDDSFMLRKPFIAAHFHGNTSHLNVETHEHYKGNGLVRVAHEAPHNVWYPSPWTMSSPHPRPTLMRNGHVHVHHTGVYLVYVQIYYLDSHDVIAWVLHRTNPEMEGREALLQCAQSSHALEPKDRPNSCFSAAALFLKAGDKLAVRNTGGSRNSLMQPEKSFIGLVKLADAEDPEQEF